MNIQNSVQGIVIVDNSIEMPRISDKYMRKCIISSFLRNVMLEIQKKIIILVPDNVLCVLSSIICCV